MTQAKVNPISSNHVLRCVAKGATQTSELKGRLDVQTVRGPSVDALNVFFCFLCCSMFA